MGWQYRKSTKIGPFRVTATKKGISTSAGVKGFLVSKGSDGKTRSTVSVPGVGLRKTKVWKKKK